MIEAVEKTQKGLKGFWTQARICWIWRLVVAPNLTDLCLPVNRVRAVRARVRESSKYQVPSTKGLRRFLM